MDTVPILDCCQGKRGVFTMGSSTHLSWTTIFSEEKGGMLLSVFLNGLFILWATKQLRITYNDVLRVKRIQQIESRDS